MGGRADGAAPRRNLYGRRHGKRLRPAQRRLLEELLPRLAIPGVAPGSNPERAPLDRAALFPDGRPLWLEIGFGGGEHLAHQAAAHPEVGLIGCEPFVNGVAMALGRIAAAGLTNVRLHPGDARDLIELLPEASLARVFLLYPDPWPKARHHRRRFVNAENLALLRPRDGGRRRAAARHRHRGLCRARAGGGGGRPRAGACARRAARPWPGWPGTRYEAKALRAGRRPHYLTFVRI